MAKETFQHVLPPERVGKGRIPLEYSLMPEAERFLARIEAAGDADDLLTATQFAGAIDTYAQWAREAWPEGRGPKPTHCGRLTMFRRGDVVAWLRFLAREHKALSRRARAA